MVLQKQNRCSDKSCLQPKHWTKRTAPWMKYRDDFKGNLRKFPGEPVREPWCPALISVVCLFLFVTSRSTWMFLSLEPSVFWHIEFSHSSLWKEIHNSFIYSTMSAASAAKLPFPFCRIPLSRSFLILYPLEIPLIYFYFLSNFHFAFYLSYSYGSFNIFQIIL